MSKPRPSVDARKLVEVLQDQVQQASDAAHLQGAVDVSAILAWVCGTAKMPKPADLRMWVLEAFEQAADEHPGCALKKTVEFYRDATGIRRQTQSGRDLDSIGNQTPPAASS